MATEGETGPQAGMVIRTDVTGLEGGVIGMTDSCERDKVWRAGILRDRRRDEGKVGWTFTLYEWLMTKTLVMTEMIARSWVNRL